VELQFSFCERREYMKAIGKQKQRFGLPVRPWPSSLFHECEAARSREWLQV